MRRSLLTSVMVINAGLFFSACGGGLGVGFGPAPLGATCASGEVWVRGNSESATMNPGYACRSCHSGQNFNGQNPSASRESGRAYFFMGTAYSSLHEADLCAASQVPADAVVEILDANDVVQLTLHVNSVGNFYSSSTQAQVPLPYRAQVRANGKVQPMGQAQTVGDCNTCHTDTGLNGAPGRIIWPQ